MDSLTLILTLAWLLGVATSIASYTAYYNLPARYANTAEFPLLYGILCLWILGGLVAVRYFQWSEVVDWLVGVVTTLGLVVTLLVLLLNAQEIKLRRFRKATVNLKRAA